MAVFLKNPGKIFVSTFNNFVRKGMLIQKSSRTETKDIVSPCQLYFFVRSGHWLTLGQRMQNIMAAISITNWIKRSSAAICVSGTALWDACCPFAWQALGFENMMAVLRGPAMQLTCNTHATHSQHNTQHEHFSCKFSITMRVLYQNLIFAFQDRILGQPLEIRTFIENLQEKCSCCVLC